MDIIAWAFLKKMARKVEKSQIKHEFKLDILISNQCSEHF